jgi:hypothetical protein
MSQDQTVLSKRSAGTSFKAACHTSRARTAVAAERFIAEACVRMTFADDPWQVVLCHAAGRAAGVFFDTLCTS